MYLVVLAFLCFNCYRLGYALGLLRIDVNMTLMNVSVYKANVSMRVSQLMSKYIPRT